MLSDDDRSGKTVTAVTEDEFGQRRHACSHNKAQTTSAHDVIRETLNAWETGTNHCTLPACLQVVLARHEQKYKINFNAHDANLEVKQQQPRTSRKRNSFIDGVLTDLTEPQLGEMLNYS